MTPNIPIIAWMPDGDPTIPGVLTDVYNLVPTKRGYASEYSLAATSFPAGFVTLPAAPAGGATLFFANGTNALLFGSSATASKLYAMSSSAVDVSRTSPAYAAADKIYAWRFGAIGDVALAVQYDNILQYWDVSSGSKFADVSGAPKANTLAVQRGFVVLGAYDAGSRVSDGWICSALDDYTDWTPDIATQCASGRLTATAGEIVRLISFQDYVIAFKKRGVYRGTYVGAADNTWSWPLVSANIGLVSHDAICEADGVLYWMGFDGMYRWAGGPIERIRSAPWEWMMANFSGDGYLTFNTSCAWDPVTRCVRWMVDFNAAARTIISYHVDTDRWGRMQLSASYMLQTSNGAVPSVDYDALNFARTGSLLFVSSDPTTLHKLQSLSGANSYSHFVTGDIGDDDQAFVITRVRARFVWAPATSNVTHYYRANLGDPLSTGEIVSRANGQYDISHAARWHRLKFTQTGRCEVTGISVETPKAGKR